MGSIYDGKKIFSPTGTPFVKVERGEIKALDGSLIARIEGDRINDPFGGLIARTRPGAEGKTEVTDPFGNLLYRVTGSGSIEDGPGGRIGFIK